jgi:hypothetical protein
VEVFQLARPGSQLGLTQASIRPMRNADIDYAQAQLRQPDLNLFVFTVLADRAQPAGFC